MLQPRCVSAVAHERCILIKIQGEMREKLVNILSVPTALETVVFRWRLARADDRQIVPHASELEGRLRVVVPGLNRIEYSRLSAGPWGF